MKKLAGLEITNSQYQHIVDILIGKKDNELHISTNYTQNLNQGRRLNSIKYLYKLGKCFTVNYYEYLLSITQCKTAIDKLSTKLNKS